jgi:hypothetical protein
MSSLLPIRLKEKQTQCRMNADRSQRQPCRAVASRAYSSCMCNPTTRYPGYIVGTQLNPDERRIWLLVDYPGLVGSDTRNPRYATGQPTLECCSGFPAGLSWWRLACCIYLVELQGYPSGYGDTFLYLVERCRTSSSQRSWLRLSREVGDVPDARMGPRLAGDCAWRIPCLVGD